MPWLSVVGLVDGGLGVTLAPAMAACASPQGVVAIPIAQARRCTELVIVYGREDGHPTRARRARNRARRHLSGERTAAPHVRRRRVRRRR